jgi:hypothetical protein
MSNHKPIIQLVWQRNTIDFDEIFSQGDSSKSIKCWEEGS